MAHLAAGSHFPTPPTPPWPLEVNGDGAADATRFDVMHPPHTPTMAEAIQITSTPLPTPNPVLSRVRGAAGGRATWGRAGRAATRRTVPDFVRPHIITESAVW